MRNDRRRDRDLEENVLRDIYAVSTFGDIEEILEDLRASQERERNSDKPEMSRRRSSTPTRSRWRTRGNFRTGPDLDPPPVGMGMGRGAVLEALGGTINGYRCPPELIQGLQEIGSGSYRNEEIEACYDASRDDEEIRRRIADFEDECPVDAANVAEAASPSAGMCLPSTSSPAKESTPTATKSTPSPKKSTPAAKTKKGKKRFNVVLQSYLAKKTAEVADDGAAEPAVPDKPVSRATEVSAADDDASSDVFIVNGRMHFLRIGDSYTSSELEVESQESYLVEDGQSSSAYDGLGSSINNSQTSDDLKASAGTDVSASSSPSKSSVASKKSSGGSRKSSSGKSQKSYHGTSRRKRMVPLQLVPPQNPALGRQSPIGDFYVPQIYNNTFTLNRREFPPL